MDQNKHERDIAKQEDPKKVKKKKPFWQRLSSYGAWNPKTLNSKQFKPNGKRETERRLKQSLNFTPIKITPRREGDFMGKHWSRLNA